MIKGKKIGLSIVCFIVAIMATIVSVPTFAGSIKSIKEVDDLNFSIRVDEFLELEYVHIKQVNVTRKSTLLDCYINLNEVRKRVGDVNELTKKRYVTISNDGEEDQGHYISRYNMMEFDWESFDEMLTGCYLEVSKMNNRIFFNLDFNTKRVVKGEPDQPSVVRYGHFEKPIEVARKFSESWKSYGSTIASKGSIFVIIICIIVIIVAIYTSKKKNVKTKDKNESKNRQRKTKKNVTKKKASAKIAKKTKPKKKSKSHL